MADGDVCLDSEGRVILDADGNVMLDSGNGCCGCCGGGGGDPTHTCESCGDCCISSEATLTLNISDRVTIDADGESTVGPYLDDMLAAFPLSVTRTPAAGSPVDGFVGDPLWISAPYEFSRGGESLRVYWFAYGCGVLQFGYRLEIFGGGTWNNFETTSAGERVGTPAQDDCCGFVGRIKFNTDAFSPFNYSASYAVTAALGNNKCCRNGLTCTPITTATGCTGDHTDDCEEGI
jgi:hypothetical protein